MSRLVLIPLFLSGCILGGGGSFPDRYSKEFCSTMFTCMDEDEVELWFDYDDVTECRDEFSESIEDSQAYEGWEEGDCTYDPEAAKSCLQEVSEMTSDNDCDGDMSYLTFALDAMNDDCSEVYDCD